METLNLLSPPLYSIEAEEAILGYILTHPDRIGEVPLKSSHFHDERHRILWSAISGLSKTGNVDFISLGEHLERTGNLNKIGGIQKLTGLINAAPIGINIKRVSDIIRDYASRRAALELAGDIARAAQELSQPLKDKTPDFISRLVDASESGAGAKHWSGDLTNFADDISKRMDSPQDIWGIPTGFSRFDYITGGIQPGESFLLSGKPGVGKSILVMQMAEQMAQNAPGAIYSLEMKASQVIRRIVSANSKVPARLMKTGRLDGDQCASIYDILGKLSELSIFLSDKASLSTTDLHADLSRLKAQQSIKWFVLDYMLLLSDGAGLNETEKTAMTSRAIKLICRDLDLAGITVHSMNKAGMETLQPDQSNLRGSGQVSYDGDLICFLTKFQVMNSSDGFIPEKDQDNMRTLFFAKGRELENPTRFIHLVKIPESPKFADYCPSKGAPMVSKKDYTDV